MHINTLEELRFHFDIDRQFLPEPRLYLLFDSDISSELSSTYFLLDDTPEYYPLFLNTHLEEHIQHSPYLIAITEKSSKFMDWFFTYGKQWGFFYFSTHSLDEALKHWHSIIFTTSNNVKSNTLLRIYDPKILLSILNDKDPKKITNALAPCESLYFQNEKNQWIKYNAKEGHNNSTKSTRQHPDHAIYINAISKRCELILWDKSPYLIAKFSPQSLDTAIHQGVSIALNNNFTQQHSILAFLRLWLERGPTSLNSREMQRYLQTPSISYTDKIDYLKENTPQEDSWNQAPNPPIII